MGSLLTVAVGLYGALGRRFDVVDKRFDAVDHRLDRLETRIEKLDDRAYALAVGLKPLIDEAEARRQS